MQSIAETVKGDPSAQPPLHAIAPPRFPGYRQRNDAATKTSDGRIDREVEALPPGPRSPHNLFRTRDPQGPRERGSEGDAALGQIVGCHLDGARSPASTRTPSSCAARTRTTGIAAVDLNEQSFSLSGLVDWRKQAAVLWKAMMTRPLTSVALAALVFAIAGCTSRQPGQSSGAAFATPPDGGGVYRPSVDPLHFFSL